MAVELDNDVHELAVACASGEWERALAMIPDLTVTIKTLWRMEDRVKDLEAEAREVVDITAMREQAVKVEAEEMDA